MTEPQDIYLPRHLDPWPHDSLEEYGGEFDPNRPRFADIPLITSSNGEITVVRGTLEQSTRAALESVAESLDVGQTYGVHRRSRTDAR